MGKTIDDFRKKKLEEVLKRRFEKKEKESKEEKEGIGDVVLKEEKVGMRLKIDIKNFPDDYAEMYSLLRNIYRTDKTTMIQLIHTFIVARKKEIIDELERKKILIEKYGEFKKFPLEE